MIRLRHVNQTISLSLVLLSLSACSSSNSGSTPADVLSIHSGVSNTQGGLRLVNTLPPPANSNDGLEQPLTANDVLQVEVFQTNTLNRTVQIDSAGRVSLPLIGTITAAGKTVRVLEQEIETAYGKSYLQSPDVSVFLKESVGQRVTVDGEVAKAGLYPVASGATLLDVIAQAGGFKDIADQRKVFVFRDVGSKKLVANYSVADIRSGRLLNPKIYGRDVIFVFTSQNRVALNNLKEALGMASNASRLAIIP